jgi:hypothetical protein
VGEPAVSSHCRRKRALPRVGYNGMVAIETTVPDKREGAVEKGKREREREMPTFLVKVTTRRYNISLRQSKARSRRNRKLLQCRMATRSNCGSIWRKRSEW